MSSTEVIEPDARVGQLLGGKYRVVRVLGSGGMGVVFEAVHEFTKQRGALKLLRPEVVVSAESVARFLREAAAAGLTQSPHVVQTFDAGLLDEDEPYTFMELLEGRSLSEELVQRPKLSVSEALAITRQAAAGLQAVHAAGIVHRDIKPANMFLVRGDELLVKLLDFGVSKFATVEHGSLQQTKEGTLLGTPLYMSPEQILGRKVDRRSDVYSLAVVLYQMLTGRPPFAGESLMELSVRIHAGEYAPVHTFRTDLPASLEGVIATGMAQNADQRYPDAGALSRALSACCGAEPLGVTASVVPLGASVAAQPVASSDAESLLGAESLSGVTEALGNGRAVSAASDPALAAAVSLKAEEATLDFDDTVLPVESRPAETPKSSRAVWIMALAGGVLGMSVWLLARGGPESVESNAELDPLGGAAALKQGDRSAPAEVDNRVQTEGENRAPVGAEGFAPVSRVSPGADPPQPGAVGSTPPTASTELSSAGPSGVALQPPPQAPKTSGSASPAVNGRRGVSAAGESGGSRRSGEPRKSAARSDGLIDSFPLK